MTYKIAFIIVLIIFLLYIAFSIIFYRRRMNKINTVLSNVNDILENRPAVPIQERTQYTIDLLSLIDNLIDYEIISNRRYEIFLNQKIKNIDVDKEYNEIANQIFSYLSPDIFDDPNNIITQKAIMSYIQKRSFVEFMRYIQNMGIGSNGEE